MTRPHPLRAILTVSAAAALVVALAACSPGGSNSSATITDGKLTIATGQPAYSPWIEDNKPQSGKGLESAVAYAVAKQLGYSSADVVWKRSTFDSAIAPGAKDWDMNIQQFSINAKRKKAVDMSTAYYTTPQAVVTTKSSQAAHATTKSALKDETIGVAAGSTSIDVVKSELGTTPQVFNSNDDAVAALKAGQIDAVVTDLPTEFHISGSQLDNGVVSAQFSERRTDADQFGFVLPKDSKLTSKVNRAIATLKKNGTLRKLTDKWLSSEVDAPIIK